VITIHWLPRIDRAVVAAFPSRRIGASVTSILARADAIAAGDLTRAAHKSSGSGGGAGPGAICI